ncbi:hypothetical protein [Leptospira interrogans]|nr:hypothetical protein [Leptospira interrogans]
MTQNNPIIDRIKRRIFELAKFHNLRKGESLSVQNITSSLMKESNGPVEKGPEISATINQLIAEGLFTAKNADPAIFLTDLGYKYIEENL